MILSVLFSATLFLLVHLLFFFLGLGFWYTSTSCPCRDIGAAVCLDFHGRENWDLFASLRDLYNGAVVLHARYRNPSSTEGFEHLHRPATLTLTTTPLAPFFTFR